MLQKWNEEFPYALPPASLNVNVTWAWYNDQNRGIHADLIPLSRLQSLVKCANCDLFQAQDPVQDYSLHLMAGK